MEKLGTGFFEQIIDGESEAWERTRQRPETMVQCAAAIVVILGEISHELNELNKEPLGK